ncbi:hypothetical protein D6D24_02257 [Aureobasidium pullulans]|uniref:Uncharacterized protein n=1 Tax=Aureobasidium pullulans TaxID=5580 RepID=A0A4S8WAS2_AURPU|nr:hypothetical protein D6D24_02257 [Aureobasidium pullulans]
MNKHTSTTQALSRGVLALPSELRLMVWTHLALAMTSSQVVELTQLLSNVTTIDACKRLHLGHPMLATKFCDEYLENFFRVVPFVLELTRFNGLEHIVFGAALLRTSGLIAHEGAWDPMQDIALAVEKSLQSWIGLASRCGVKDAIAPIRIELCVRSDKRGPTLLKRRFIPLQMRLYSMTELSRHLPRGRVTLELDFGLSMLKEGMKDWIRIPLVFGCHDQNRTNCLHILHQARQRFIADPCKSADSRMWLSWHAVLSVFVDEILEYVESL